MLTPSYTYIIHTPYHPLLHHARPPHLGWWLRGFLFRAVGGVLLRRRWCNTWMEIPGNMTFLEMLMIKNMDGEITFLPFGRKLLVLLTSSL